MTSAILTVALLRPAPTGLSEFLRTAVEKDLRVLPIGLRTAQVGMLFLDTPYVGGTLDRDPKKEECVVIWDGLDCVTFVELAWNLARLLEHEAPDERQLHELVTVTRYRDGQLEGYASRLHYTTDWMLDNQKRALLRDLTPELPGARADNRVINFMTTHPHLYPAIAEGGEKMIDLLRAHERALTQQPRFIVAREAVTSAERFLNSGDIVGITSGRAGLDTSHVGMIVVDIHGVRRFLHASTAQKKVILDDRLSAYVARNPSATGIIVARPLPATKTR